MSINLSHIIALILLIVFFISGAISGAEALLFLLLLISFKINLCKKDDAY